MHNTILATWVEKNDKQPLKLAHVKDCNQEKRSFITSSEMTCGIALQHLHTKIKVEKGVVQLFYNNA